MTASAYDIEIGGKGYLLMPGGYMMSESPKSFPARGTASTREFQHPDNWSYFGQSDWIGEIIDDWISDGPYHSGWGLDLSSKPGEIKVAKKLEQRVTDTANTGGYVAFNVGTTRACFIGKTDGKLYTPNSATTVQKTPGDASYLAASNFPTSHAFYKGKHYLGTTSSKIWETTDGLAYTDKLTAGPSTAAYILGSYKGKLWIGYENKLYHWDGTTYSEMFPSTIDGTPILGCVGASGLFFMTDGPEAKLMMTDGNGLHQLATVKSDFKPKALQFLETLYVFGNATDETNTKGQIYRLEESGLVRVFEFGDETADYGIRSAVVDKDRIIWGANQRTGIGVFDPTMDIFEEVKMGYYVSSVITSVAGVVHGLTQFGNIYYAGIQAQGIYWQTTPGTFRVLGHRFDGDSKNINKFWGFAELRHSSLAANQTITVKTTKDATTFDTWGTSDTDATTTKVIAAPSSYKHPFIQYEMTGDAAGADMYIYDISLAFIEASDNPKREWDLVLGIEGSTDRPQICRDGSDNDRTAATMFTDLTALWNTVTTFKDINNTTYNVVMKMPRARAEEFIKDVDAGNSLVELVLFYRLHLTQL